MFKKITTAVVLLSGLSFGASATAAEVSLEQLVSAMVSQAVAKTSQELGYGVQEAVLTAGNMVSLDSSEKYATKVNIKDLSDEKGDKQKAE
ncbi:hypothetical protein LJ739_14635 [Aestuariibacter halophilus]|uniref:Uncharacterized protein n=1 Tax=Fluctibacter halophilus TaxID=226011 RepID=A0ABS8GAB7_9ALTE|nr:hypothetical protein [Aestuariibacter halophilus]MCC2617487.1 hypothetical protein [Aestuariibacter halophilus]